MSASHLDLFEQTANRKGDTKQQRVVDVLNALARADIRKVTFTDLVEE